MLGHERQRQLNSETCPSSALLAAVALLPQSPGLPEGVWRDNCLETVITAYHRELTPAAREVLRFYARHTRPTDWTLPGRGPVAYVAQRHAAEALNLTRRTIYNAECELERLGLMIKQVSDNGRRYGPQGGDGEICGIYFAPMIEGYEAILAVSAEAAAARDKLSAARKLTSGLRFRLRRLAKQAGDRPEAHAAREALSAVPGEIMRLTGLDELERIAAILVPHIEVLESLPSVDCKPVENKQKPQKISHAWEINFPCHIYTTTNSSFVNCIPNGEKVTASKEAEDNSNLTAAYAAELPRKKNAKGGEPVNGVDVCIGGNGEKDKGSACEQSDSNAADPMRQIGAEDGKDAAPRPENSSQSKIIWTMAQLYAAASIEFRALLDIERDSTGQIDNRSFVNTAETICHYLGINISAWQDACTVMGRSEAALAILVIDRNRNHPTHPVHSPGGAIRAMTERAKQGELRIDASIFAILKRAQGDKLQ